MPTGRGAGHPAHPDPRRPAPPFMNAVWQSRCGAPARLEWGGWRAYGRGSQYDMAVCPSGLGIRLQSEAHRFDSGHGLQVPVRGQEFRALPARHSAHGTFQSP